MANKPIQKEQQNNPLQVYSTISTYAGPLPPPNILKDYNDVVPGSAERILKMAEIQSLHRQNIELIVVQSNTRNELVGMIFGFIISILTIMSSCYLIYLDKWVSGIAGVIGTLVALVAVFIYGKHSQSKEKLLKNNSSSHK
ncbi:MAG: DUF2335 domain-containing protein [Spirochaetia bacterium]|nr:DUF2335 domain-containing protein [Spirochaetia bacterium]